MIPAMTLYDEITDTNTKHECELPLIGSEQPGSHWRCECGRRWELKVRPPEDWPQRLLLEDSGYREEYGPDEAIWSTRPLSGWWRRLGRNR